MDFKIAGLFDVIFILGCIIVIIVGYKKGFMTKMVRLIASFFVVFISVFLSGHLALMMKKWEIFYPKMYDRYNGKMEKSLSKANEGDPAYSVVKRALGVPKFVAKYISKKVGTNDMTKICGDTADYLALWLTKIVAFFIILVALIIALLIILSIIKKLRNNEAVRIVDGILGILLYFSLYIMAVSFIIFIIKLGVDHSWIKGKAYEFLSKDLQLETKKFRVMKYLYQENFFKSAYEFIKR